MDWSDQRTRIRRFLRDPDSQIWSDRLLLRSYNEAQDEIQNASGKLETVKVVKVPSGFESGYMYDFEWPYTDHADGEVYMAGYYHDSTQKLHTSMWESQHLDGLTPTTTVTCHNYTQPWEALTGLITNPAEPPPFHMPANFLKMIYAAYDRDPLTPITQRELLERDMSWKTRKGKSRFYYRDSKESQKFYMYPYPSSITWGSRSNNARLDFEADSDLTGYLYYDFTAGYFNSDFTFYFEIMMESATSGGNNWVCLTSNYVGDAYAHYGGGVRPFQGVYINGYSATAYQLNCHEIDSGGSSYGTGDIGASGLSCGTIYYCKYWRDDAAGTVGYTYLNVYSDSDYSVLVGSMSLELGQGVSTKRDWRYLHAFSSYNDTSGGDDMVGYISMLRRTSLASTPADLTDYTKVDASSTFAISDVTSLSSADSSDPDTAEYGSTTLDVDDNVLAIYEQKPTELAVGSDESDLSIFLRKFIEYRVIETCYRTNSDGRIGTLADYWEMRHTVGLAMIRAFKQRRHEDRDYCLTTKTVFGSRKYRHPRLPDEYPEVYP
jgi:hypothetical protein